MFRGLLKNWKETFLAIAIIIQGFYVFDDYAFKWARLAVALRGYPSLQRGGILFSSKRFTDFMALARDVVPEDGTVIYPDGFLSFRPTVHKGVMQYFLFPRKIDSCPDTTSVGECVRSNYPDAYFLAIGHFPPEDVADQVRSLIPFEPDRWYRGLYAPIHSTVP